MLITEIFIRSLVEKYGRHTFYTDGGTWYNEACNVIGLKHYLHSSIEKSLMERVNQYFKDRIESFDDYYPCIQKETMNVTYFRYKIEYNSLYICIIIQYLLGTIILLISYKKKGKFNLLIQPILIYRVIYL